MTALTPAFAPPVSLAARTTFLQTTTATTAEKVQPRVQHATNRRAAPVLATMAPGASPAGGSRPSIDFGKVDIREAGSNLAGLIFTPEGDSPLKTRVDVGYSADQEAAVNAHINVEYTAMYAYHALWAYFDRDVVALPGFASFFNKASLEERQHAHEFMQFQNRRGGHVELQPVAVPEMKFTMQDGTSDALYAMDLSLQLEKFVYKKLQDLHEVAAQAGDAQMQDFVEGYLTHQVEAIKEVADYVSQIKRVGTPHGVYHVDLALRE